MPAEKLEPVRIDLDYARVESCEEEGFIVEMNGHAFTARKAVACLVEPEPGDLVMVSTDSFGRSYVLSVLERETNGDVSLAFDNDVEIKLKNGRLRAAAQDGIDLVSAGNVSMVSAGLSISSLLAELNVHRTSFVGGLLEGHVDKIKMVGQTCESIFERVSQKVKNSYRWVSGLDQVKAEHMSYLVKKLMSLRGKYSVITAEEDVRVDGKHILMG